MLFAFLKLITVLTITPFFFDLLFKTEKERGANDEDDDPYKGIIFTVYKRVLTAAINHRYVTIVLVLVALVGSMASGKFVKNAFSQIHPHRCFVDLWLPEGSDILTTEQSIRRLENNVLGMENIANVTSVIGGGAQRLTLTYAPEDDTPVMVSLSLKLIRLSLVMFVCEKLSSWCEKTSLMCNTR